MVQQSLTKLNITIISKDVNGAPHRRTISGVTKIEVKNGSLILHKDNGPVEDVDGVSWYRIEGQRSDT